MASTEAAQDLASMAGFTVAFFNSDPALKTLFNKALAENWTGDRLLQEARNTTWFKTHSDANREATLLSSSDPATYKARAEDMNLRVTRMAVELGIPLGTTMRQTTSRLALTSGWNDDQIRNYLGRWKTVRNAINQGQTLGGSIGQTTTRIRALARAQGVQLATGTLANWMQGVASGLDTEQGVVAKLNKIAAGYFPGLADRILAGETVRDIAEPYVQTMAKLWEMNPAEIDMFNPKIRGALSVKGQDGKFSMLTVPDFERQLKKDPRWMRTDNAQDELMESGHQVLNAIGVTW